jgi:hypothetical protein
VAESVRLDDDEDGRPESPEPPEIAEASEQPQGAELEADEAPPPGDAGSDE